MYNNQSYDDQSDMGKGGGRKCQNRYNQHCGENTNIRQHVKDACN